MQTGYSSQIRPLHVIEKKTSGMASWPLMLNPISAAQKVKVKYHSVTVATGLQHNPNNTLAVGND